MVCLGLTKHFPLILLSFAACLFKSVCFPKSRAFTLLWGIFRYSYQKFLQRLIQLLESSKPLPVRGYQALRIPLLLGRDPELTFQFLFTV